MKERYILFVLFIFSLILYAFTLRGIYGNPTGKMVKNGLDQASKPLELSPERGRYLLILSLGENRSFSLSKELADAAYPDVGYYKGKFYVFFAPGISLLALPLYWIGKYFNIAQAASFFTISIFAAISLLFIYKISRNIYKLPIWAALLSSLIFGFGSTSWSYANTLYQHHVTVFCIMSSLYAVWKYRQKNKQSWLWALFVWFNYALAIAIDYPNALLMLPIMIYFFFSAFSIHMKDKISRITFRMNFLSTSAIFIIICLAHGYFNYTHFGGWTKVSNGILGYKKIVELKLFKEKDPEKIITALEKDKVPIKFFKEDNLPRGVAILLFAIDKGLFLFSPIFILAIFGIFGSLSTRTFETGVMLGSIGLNIFLYSSFGDPWGGWAYGPRYLIPSMAILSIFVAIWLAKTKFQIFGRVAAFILFTISSGIALLGALTTNAVPPKIEADYLKMKYNFFLNWDFLIDNRSSSFIYNTFFADKISLIQYFVYIFFSVMIALYLVLFLLPLFKEFNTVPKNNTIK